MKLIKFVDLEVFQWTVSGTHTPTSEKISFSTSASIHLYIIKSKYRLKCQYTTWAEYISRQQFAQDMNTFQWKHTDSGYLRFYY